MSLNTNSFPSKITSWIREHKLLSGIATFFFVLILLLLIGLLGLSSSSSTGIYPSSVQQDVVSRSPSFSDEGVQSDGGGTTDIPGIQIKEARVSVDSDDIDSDEATVRAMTDSHGGYIESAERSEGSTWLRTHMTARVLASNFTRYIDNLRNRLEVEDYTVRDYRIEIERRTTKLDIIQDTLSMYEQMKQEAQEMPLGAERLELIMDITDRQVDLKDDENRLQQQIDEITRRGDMATVNITLEEKQSPELWPEDLGNTFLDRLADAIQQVTTILVSIVTTSLVVFMTALQWAIYIIISLIVLWFAYRLLRWLYKKTQ